MNQAVQVFVMVLVAELLTGCAAVLPTVQATIPILVQAQTLAVRAARLNDAKRQAEIIAAQKTETGRRQTLAAYRTQRDQLVTPAAGIVGGLKIATEELDKELQQLGPALHANDTAADAQVDTLAGRVPTPPAGGSP